MPVSAGEIERAESRAKAKAPRQCAEEYRLEAVEYYRRAREADPRKGIRECAAELGINDKTLNDWVIKFGRTGKVTQARTDEQKEPDEARRRIRELESENESLKKQQPSSPGASDGGQVPADAGGEGGLQRLDDGAGAGREQVGVLPVAEGGRQRGGSKGPPQGGHHRDMGREREALRPPQGLVEADGRPQVRPLRGNDPLPRPEMHVRAGDTRHLPQCLQEDDGAGQGCARAARPHGERLPGPRPDHEARGRHNLSQDHGRLHLPGRGHRPVRAWSSAGACGTT